MTYAKSETAYQDAYKSFKDNNISPAIEYIITRFGNCKIFVQTA